MDSENQAKIEEIVRKAGVELMKKWPGAASNGAGTLKSERKEDGSLVTEADFASNQIIVEGLQSLFPEDSILSEELPREQGLQEVRRLWIIDPLDGTAHFAKGLDDFSILVGLCENGIMEFGVMHFPARDQYAIGARGVQAQLNGERLSPSTEKQIRPRRLYIRNFEVAPEHQGLVYDAPMDSGMALLSVCNGTFDGAIIRMTSHKEWDIAAPAVVIEGCGGRVSDERGEALRFNEGSVYFDYFVASNGAAHDELLNVIRASEQ